MIVSKQWWWHPVELSLVQILVLVANNPMRSRMTEVEKGFTWSLLRREWPGPKRILNWSELSFFGSYVKGKQVNIPVVLLRCWAVTLWNWATPARCVERVFFSFWQTCSQWNRIILRSWVLVGKVGDLLTYPLPSRWSVKSLGTIFIIAVAVLITASGLLGEKPLVDVIM